MVHPHPIIVLIEAKRHLVMPEQEAAHPGAVPLDLAFTDHRSRSAHSTSRIDQEPTRPAQTAFVST
jgi:hypothetical protein